MTMMNILTQMGAENCLLSTVEMLHLPLQVQSRKQKKVLPMTVLLPMIVTNDNIGSSAATAVVQNENDSVIICENSDGVATMIRLFLYC